MKIMNTEQGPQSLAVLGQKYAYATISLILGVSCFINLVGMEKAILAVVFGVLALKSAPAPALMQRRLWAKVGVVLGGIALLVVPTLILLNLDRLRLFVETLKKLSDGR